MEKSVSNDKQVVLKVVETLNKKDYSVKRSYKSYLIEISSDVELNKVTWSRKSKNVYLKTIFVKLYQEDEDVTDLTKTKSFFRAKISLRLAGDKA